MEGEIQAGPKMQYKDQLNNIIYLQITLISVMYEMYRYEISRSNDTIVDHKSL